MERSLNTISYDILLYKTITVPAYEHVNVWAGLILELHRFGLCVYLTYLVTLQSALEQ